MLDDRRYTGTDVPRPFTGVLEWIGDRIEPIVDWFEERVDDLPGPPGFWWVSLAAGVLILAGLLAARVINRSAGGGDGGGRLGGGLGPRDDPRKLEREADEAERAGEWERAVRLRFRAGLLRLDERDAISYRPSLTTGEVARAIRSPTFDDLGVRFDRIAYGGAPAAEPDAGAQREGWPRVLEEAGRR